MIVSGIQTLNVQRAERQDESRLVIAGRYLFSRASQRNW
jgi:hypothetical protein